VDSLEKVTFYKQKESAGCPDGYKGRRGIHEILRMSEAIKDVVIKGGTSDQIEEQARKEGMHTMIEDGVMKAAMGMTTIEEVLRVTSE